MKNLNMDELTNQYYDVLKELGNIGAGNATTALAQMIGCKVDMSVPKVQLLDFNKLGELVGGEDELMVGIYLQVEGDIEGSMMFIQKKVSAAHLVNKRCVACWVLQKMRLPAMNLAKWNALRSRK